MRRTGISFAPQGGFRGLSADHARRGASRPRPRLHRAAIPAALLLAGALATLPLLAAPPYAGEPLAAALQDLESRGLKLVFTSNVVRPEMIVESEPTGGDPRAVLAELLAPHGLVATDGPNRTILVLPRPRGEEPEPALGTISGTVRTAAGVPLEAVVVTVPGSAREALSDAAGRFSLGNLTPGTVTIEARARGFLAGRLEVVVVAGSEQSEIVLTLGLTPIIEDQLVVTPSRLSLLRDDPLARLGLTREEILALPHLGEDFFRALTLLPGTLANDVTAQFQVRGGRRDETQILIDGQELYDAYHLKEQDNAVSLVATGTLSSADLTTGGFSAQYGDRMSGVLDMTTVTPTGDTGFRAGLGFLSTQLGGGGRFAANRGGWLVEIRRGTTDLVGRLLGDEDPRYWDAFAKIDFQLDDRSSVRGNALSSGDELDFAESIEGDEKRFLTEYDSHYFWVTHQLVLNARLYFDTAFSATSIKRQRRAVEMEEEARFTIFDDRDLDVLGLRQAWALAPHPKHRLSWGWRLRDFDTRYDYLSTRSFENPLALIRHDGPENELQFAEQLKEEQQSGYLIDRVQLSDRLTAELGLRFDRHTQTRESHLTPRLNLAWALGERDVLRLAWGRYHQSQRPYEIQVEDGETGFHPVERSEHRVVGFERIFPGAGKRSPATFRVELYQRLVKNPRTRYENLYEPINSFPEVEPDRVLVAAQRARAQGVEIFVRGGHGDRIAWWANYTWARTEDRVDGAWIPRLFDQAHSLNLDLDYRIGEHWRINLAWRLHTGWPTTPLSVARGIDDEGEQEFVPVLGPLNGDRLGDYHRLDLRASRQWVLKSATLGFYLDIQNAYDRENDAGFDVSIDSEDGTIERVREPWPGLLPSAGVTIEF